MRAFSKSTLLVVAVAGLLGACTKTKAPETEAAAPAAAEPPKERVVNLYIWSDYTSKEMLEAFTKKTGIKVQEANYSSNEELLAKLQAGATGFDLAVPSDYMVSVMTKLGLLSDIDKSKIPNAKSLDGGLLGRPYDPTNKVSLPYAWGVTGIAVNRALYKDPVTGWADLLANPKVAGRISLLDDVREVLGASLKLNGFSLNSKSEAELNKAKANLAAAKRNVKAFNSTPADLLKSNEVMLAHMYSGEALVAARDSGKPIEFVIPKEGGTLAIDNMVLLKNATHPEEALALMNFFLEVEANADFVKRTLFGPVVVGVKDKLPPELQNNAVLFPPAATLANCEMMQDLGDTTQIYDRIWSELKAQSH